MNEQREMSSKYKFIYLKSSKHKFMYQKPSKHTHILKIFQTQFHILKSWSTHCDNIIKKSNCCFYALRKLKSCGVQEGELVAVYCSLLRSVLEYASVVFANLPQYLCKAVERVQKSALKIICGSDLSYKDALAWAGLLSPEARRHLACKKFVLGIMHTSPLHPLISSRVVSSQTQYFLRLGPSCHVLLCNS